MVERKPLLEERRGLLLLCLPALLAVAALLWGRLQAPPGRMAAVYWNGQQVYRFALTDGEEPVVISMRELGFDVPVSFELQNGKIRFVHVDCPDKLCEGFGFIGLENETAVCMPNRVSISILSE